MERDAAPGRRGCRLRPERVDLDELRQAAAALLHLAIDAFIYLAQGKPVLGVSTGEKVAEAPAPYDAPAAKPAPAPALPGTAPLPEVLRAVADETLGFPKDGHHVLLAGAPGPW